MNLSSRPGWTRSPARFFIRRNLGRESNPWFTTGTRVYQFRNEPIIGPGEAVVKSVVAFSLNPCQRYRRYAPRKDRRREHPRDSSPTPLSSSYRIHFRLFQLRRAFFALLPRGWCFRGSATDKIFRVEAGYSRAVFPDVRIFLARISLERNSREGRGRESPSVKIFEERKFLLGIFTDLCKSLATF